MKSTIVYLRDLNLTLSEEPDQLITDGDYFYAVRNDKTLVRIN